MGDTQATEAREEKEEREVTVPSRATLSTNQYTTEEREKEEKEVITQASLTTEVREERAPREETTHRSAIPVLTATKDNTAATNAFHLTEARALTTRAFRYKSLLTSSAFHS